MIQDAICGINCIGVQPYRDSPLNNVPSIFSSVTELAASNTGGQTVVADGDLLIDKLIGKIIRSLGHCSDEDADALLWLEALNIFSDLDNFSIETESDLAAVWWKVIADWVLNNLQKLLLRVGRANGETMEKLDHETSESLESTRNANGWRDLNQDALGGVDIDL